MSLLNAIGAHYAIIPRQAMEEFGCSVVAFPPPSVLPADFLPPKKKSTSYEDGLCLSVCL